jgi:DNA-binding MarR family transcriptional regulator
MSSRVELETHIQVLLARIAHEQSVISHKALVPLQLSRSQFALLVQFIDSPDDVMTITQLVEVMDMNQPGVTKIVRQLLEQGYLETTQNSKDKRVKEIRATKKGLNKCEKALSILKPISVNLFSQWKLNDLKEIGGYLEKLNADLKQ